MPPHDPEIAAWFEAQVHPHEAMLRAWLTHRFSSDCDIDDIVQEAFARIIEAHRTQNIESPKAFLFATARNLAVGRLRRRRVAGDNLKLAEYPVESVLDEAANVREEVAHSQELEILSKAILSLPKRCRQIITLRKIYGLSQKEVAAQLGISEHTVEAQGTIGLKKITAYFEQIDSRRAPSRER